MAKYGNFNYDESSPVTEILAQYKVYRKKDVKGLVAKTELDELKASLKDYQTKERTALISAAAQKVNGAKATQLTKYASFPDDFDFKNTKALEKELITINKDMYGEVTDEASKAKTKNTGIKIEPTPAPVKKRRFVQT